jgi:transcriptional regulator of acetoin/glycerol metabolism
MSRVARTLGIGRSTLYRKIRQYGLEDGLAELPA